MTRLWAKTALMPNGWRRSVAVDIDLGGRIVAAAAGQPVSGQRCDVLLPAPPNLHSHAFQRGMAGLAERRGPAHNDDFWSWRRQMYWFVNLLTPEDIQAIAALAQMEMLESGFGSVVEFHYLHHDRKGTPYDDPAEMSWRIAAAAESTGIGLTLLPVLYQQGGCDGAPLGAHQARFGCTRDQYGVLLEATSRVAASLRNDARSGVAVHSLRAVSPKVLAWAAEIKGESPLHMHLAEQQAEVLETEAVLGARPVTWVLDHCEVNSSWCLIHCTQMLPQEAARLAATGAVAGLCPVTESNLGDGIFLGVRYVQSGGCFGVGTDSNVRSSLAEELRCLEYSQRLRDRARAALAVTHASTGRALFEGACRGGALAAGRPCGTIAPGAWGDLLELDDTAPALVGLQGDAILDAWIFAGGNREVKSLWSAGRAVVQEGRHINREAIMQCAVPVLRRLRDLCRAD